MVLPQTARLANGGFDYNIALGSVNLSAAAYCDPSVIKAWSCPPCVGTGLALDVKDVFHASETDTNGYIGIDEAGKRIIVAFQGTHDLTQWIDDLDFFKADLQYPGASSDVKVHSGFYKAYRQVKQNVDQVVNQTLFNNPEYTILVTGHSLGAALAAMCSLDLSIGHPQARILHYTYGQPRVGNQAFAQFYESHNLAQHYRMTHNEDPVPHLPLESMGFYHISTEVYYGEKFEGQSSLKVCDGSGEDPNCSNQHWTDLKVSDHLNYLGQTLDTDACHA
ncbi:uncharacterized protein MONBRDRAFT_38123 [Monosiga brevicollis MX1]|uniref:Fungal lipase-type domain-containing protein n=1 Tax=Monosiga brevicollis TaxID=81824 RepID=A9V5U1_MONBE|nr:uncharacterized protein MONBRDRAFT_38123 [Monosiga brevicollis MX1]EDQ87174.1 predicted protein [Monosiga brevicollis MX1]|eukprot:XP_001748117.1 hypothetical protein [Monosiga brevicollis MX1]